MINRVVLVGRLTNDPDLKTTSTGKNVATFSLAVQKRMKPTDGSPDADFFRVSCWEKQADFITTYGGKGRLVAVDGRLQSRKFQDKDGNNREVVEIVAENVQLLDRPREDNGTTPAPTADPDEYDPFAS